MISNCGKDENGAYIGGTAGDQTGGEWQIRSWYKGPWLCVLRHPDATVRAEIARLATNAAKNDLIGYDQGERLTFWGKLAGAGYDPANISAPCEADCSSAVMGIVKAVGYRLNLQPLRGVSYSLTTHGMRAALQGAGFEVLTDNKYLSAASYLLAGDILLNDDQHTAINVTDGSKSAGEVTAPATGTTGSTAGGTGATSGQTTTKKPPVINKGDLVSIAPNASYYDGKAVPQWVLSRRWRVASSGGLRVVLGKSEDGAYNIQSPISANYLTVVEAAQAEKPATPTPATDGTVQAQDQPPATGGTGSAAPTPEAPAIDCKVGDIVQFRGGPHYKSADAKGSNGRPGPGPAKVTKVLKGAVHPYHVIHTDNTTGVYGWVDASSLESLEAPAATTTTATGSRLVKVTAALLNVRSGPGTGNSIVTTVRAGEVLAITEEQDGWGRMQSGAGWVKLCYTAPQQPEAVG